MNCELRIEEIKNAAKYIAVERKKLWYEYKTWKSLNPDKASEAMEKYENLIKVVRGLTGSLGAIKRNNKQASEIPAIKENLELFEKIMGYDLLKYSNRSADSAALRADINCERTQTDTNGNAYLNVELL